MLTMIGTVTVLFSPVLFRNSLERMLDFETVHIAVLWRTRTVFAHKLYCDSLCLRTGEMNNRACLPIFVVIYTWLFDWLLPKLSAKIKVKRDILLLCINIFSYLCKKVKVIIKQSQALPNGHYPQASYLIDFPRDRLSDSPDLCTWKSKVWLCLITSTITVIC